MVRLVVVPVLVLAAVGTLRLPDAFGPVDGPYGPGSASPAVRQVLPAAQQARRAAWEQAADDAASLLVVVAKKRPLDPVTYAPSDLQPAGAVLLRAEAAQAFARLAAGAAVDDAPVRAVSGFRSYADQVTTYRHWVRVLGAATADQQSARPGFSEHQTGLAVDVLPATGTCQAFECFGTTVQAGWLAAHAADYGFVVRYQAGQQAVTGYTAEPWHLRYVGVQAARDVAAAGALSLEEYLGLPAAPGY